ncbi:MAG: pyridoxal-phosphate dependent enzyme [Chitinophagaceae bacterium]
MQDINLSLARTEEIMLPAAVAKQISLSVLRLDKIHPFVSGNKWFKLRYYLDEAKAQGKRSVVTFGGAWSNHILATAAACKINGLASTGIIRGEAPGHLSSTLTRAKELGMQLVFLNRDDYRNKKIPAAWSTGDHYIIPEGGYGIKGAAGAATIADLYSEKDFTHSCCAAGTGTMTAGLVSRSSPSSKIISFSVLKNNAALEEDIAHLIPIGKKSPALIHDYHFGGYAKHTPSLLVFMNDFYRQVNIPTDFVYTAKLFYGVTDLIQQDYFPTGSRLLVVHSGGLQGNDSLGKRTLIF